MRDTSSSSSAAHTFTSRELTHRVKQAVHYRGGTFGHVVRCDVVRGRGELCQRPMERRRVGLGEVCRGRIDTVRRRGREWDADTSLWEVLLSGPTGVDEYNI